MNRKISTRVHTLLKVLSAMEGRPISEIVQSAVINYKTDFPEVHPTHPPMQNPLIYPTEARIISVDKSTCDYITTLPKGPGSGKSQSILDRILIHYQNTQGKNIPDDVRIRWLDPENLNWANSIPES